MNSQPKILFIKPANSSFILRDEAILKSRYPVESFLFHTGEPKKYSGPHSVFTKLINLLTYVRSSIRLVLWLLGNQKQTKAIFVWFADYYVLLLGLFAKIFNKELLIAIGGYDALWIPELHYGVYDRPFRRFCVRQGLKQATYLLPVDSSLVESVNTYSHDHPLKGGIRHFNPDLKTNIIVIPTGYETDFWRMDHGIEKENLVITAGFISDFRTFKRKGIDYFVETAGQLLQHRFLIIGLEPALAEQFGVRTEIPNLELIAPVPLHEIRYYFQRAKVYAQFSLAEGMPNAVCEAMLCECVPVGSNVNGIPNVIGNTGFIVKKRKVQEMKEAIQQAMRSENGALARQRIAETFPLEKRAEALYSLMDPMVQPPSSGIQPGG